MMNWQGMNWIRKEKRLAIYLRDGLACAYCGKGIEEAVLSLDHLVFDGPNTAANLVTCCQSCNATRLNKNWREFAADPQVIERILRLTNKPLNVQSAKLMLAQHNDDWTATIATVTAAITNMVHGGPRHD